MLPAACKVSFQKGSINSGFMGAKPKKVWPENCLTDELIIETPISVALYLNLIFLSLQLSPCNL